MAVSDRLAVMLISKNLFKRETLFVAQIRAEGTGASQKLLRLALADVARTLPPGFFLISKDVAISAAP